ncbi:response regulator transcription factor [Oceanithermus desulfurans]
MARILIVEDDREIAALAAAQLERAGHAVRVVHDGEAGLAEALEGGHDLLVLDVMLPGVSGFEIVERLRRRPGYPRVLMLTARAEEVDRVLGLELGADDYLTKPFSLRELEARVRALLRRGVANPEPEPAGRLVYRGLEIDPAARRVRVGGRPVNLTAREFDLLFELARHPGRVYTRAELLERVWGAGFEGYEHTVNSHINRLRAKIEPDAKRPVYVETVWGVGYRFGGGEG